MNLGGNVYVVQEGKESRKFKLGSIMKEYESQMIMFKVFRLIYLI